jgi:hypothetical protein
MKDQTGLNSDMIDWTNQVADAIGYTYPATFTLPLTVALQPLYYIRLFLDQVDIIIACLMFIRSSPSL